MEFEISNKFLTAWAKTFQRSLAPAGNENDYIMKEGVPDIHCNKESLVEKY